MKTLVKYLGVAVLVGMAVFLMLYRLDNTRLAPWDEAWYGTISKNIYKTGNIFELTFNGKHFWDHPPLAFILTAVSFMILGVNEFSARLPEALAGIAGVYLIYLTGKRLTGDKNIGLIAGVVLLSCRWFLIRSRTANLEALLLLTQLGVFYFAVNARKQKDLLYLWSVFGLALMVKSVISLSLLPLVVWASWKVMKSTKKIDVTFLVPFALISLPWYLVNTATSGVSFLNRNIFEIAFRGNGGFRTGINELKRTLLYYRSSVHKWYWPSIIGSLWALLNITDEKARWLLSYLFLVSVPYFASPTTEIWHLLPMLPAVSLLIAYAVGSISKRLQPGIRGGFVIMSLIGAVVVAAISVRSYWPSLYHEKSEAFEAKLAIASKKYPYPLYLQDTTYVPTVVFYADRNVSLIWDDKNLANTLPRPFQIITREHMLLDAKDFKVADKAGDTVLAIFE